MLSRREKTPTQTSEYRTGVDLLPYLEPLKNLFAFCKERSAFSAEDFCKSLRDGTEEDFSIPSYKAYLEEHHISELTSRELQKPENREIQKRLVRLGEIPHEINGLFYAQQLNALELHSRLNELFFLVTGKIFEKPFFEV